MNAEELKRMSDDITAGKDVASGDATIIQSTEFAKTKEVETDEKVADTDLTSDDIDLTPDVKIGISEENSSEPEVEVSKVLSNESEVEETKDEEPPKIDVNEEPEVTVDPIIVPGMDEYNDSLSSESSSIEVSPTFEPSLDVSNITFEPSANIIPDAVSQTTTDFSNDVPIDTNYSFNNQEPTISSINQSDQPLMSEDIKYFKDPNVIPKLMNIIKENISAGVQELIEKEFARLQDPMMNTSKVGERSYKLADRIVRTGPNLDSFNEYEEITKIRENGLDASSEFTSTTTTPLQSFDQFGYVAKGPEPSYTQNQMSVPEDFIPGQNIIKGDFGYGEDQDTNDNFKMSA